MLCYASAARKFLSPETVMEKKTLGSYELIRLLGRGGMGEVFLARDPRLGREVALKVLPKELAESPRRRERFEREARAAAGLKHPNITTIHDMGEAEAEHFITFEYVEGQTLESLLARGPLPFERIFNLALAMAEALDYAHSKGVVHRDLKPSNVMVSDLGIPKILDFGLAKVMPEASASSEAPTVSKLTRDGVVLGTVAYMSPEQALGRDVDPRSDIFSFGSLLYEMLSGKPAFTGATTTEVLNAVLNHAPVPLGKSTHHPSWPRSWRRRSAKMPTSVTSIWRIWRRICVI
jgi:serine/threonine protein kinase